MQKQSKAIIYALTAIFLWSTVATAFKIALRSINYVHLLLYVSIISSLLFFIIVLLEKKTKLIYKTTKNDLIHSLSLALLNPFLYYLFVFKSYAVLEAQIAQPLNYAWPVMLVLLSVPILKQKISFLEIIAIIISFTGVFFISSSGNILDYKITDPLGISLAFGSSIIWALFWILNVLDKRDETIKLFFIFCIGSVYTFIYCLITNNLPSFPNFDEFFVIIYIGFFEMGFTFLLWMKAMKNTKSTAKISNFVFLSPFVSLIFLHFIIGENIYFTTFIGLILIVVGILFQKFTRKKHSQYLP